MPEPSLSAIAHAIQLAVAPVFLVTGVAALLNVLTNRLARIIDRSRTLRERTPSTPATRTELQVLARRAICVNRGVAWATLSALLIATLIVILFVGAFLALNLALEVGVLFVLAMLTLIAALLMFLQEIRLAARAFHSANPEPAG
jgi:Protein of unknown function (DUF2721)